MCCFSQPVDLVADTSIFARASSGGRQFLVYSMRYAAASELAMVLPLPVPPGPSEDAVRFLNLQSYPDFFQDLQSGYPQPECGPSEDGPLQIHDVGDFEASFVPRMQDFGRLDERFRIGREVWDRVPTYHDFGFAVFKLKEAPSLSETAHPMAFEFPRRNADLLYFPTLHVHDRTVSPHADFAHTLYCQTEDTSSEWLDEWWQTRGPASRFMDVERTQGIVAPDLQCRLLRLHGRHENMDTLVGKGGQIPQAATR
jgi:hypothetical protein